MINVLFVEEAGEGDAVLDEPVEEEVDVGPDWALAVVDAVMPPAPCELAAAVLGARSAINPLAVQ
jgi:hypothetical protein